jgi:hypothetical protein
LTQSIWKQIQKSGLAKLYKENARFNNNIKMICALAFVPDAFVNQEFENYLITS